MAFERVAEQRLRQAIAEGWLDDLPNRGERIDFEEYLRTPEDVRLTFSVLKSANCLPEEVELRNDIARLERTLASAASDDDRQAIRHEIARRTLRLDLLTERAKRRRPR